MARKKLAWSRVWALAAAVFLTGCAMFGERQQLPPADAGPAVTCLVGQDCDEPQLAAEPTESCRVVIQTLPAYVIDPMEDDPAGRFRVFVPELEASFELRRDDWFVNPQGGNLGMQTPLLLDVAVGREPFCDSYVNALRLRE